MSERLGAQLQSGGLGQSIHTGLFGGGLFAGASLDLNFAVTKNIGPLVTFTRASTATFIDSAGVLQTAATDVPRFDHNPTTGESLGLLVEEQRTNLLLQSQAISLTAPWTSQGNAPTINANAFAAPDGTTTATRVTFAASDSRVVQGNFSVTAGVTYTLSVYARPVTAGTLNTIRLAFFDTVQQNSSDIVLSAGWQRIAFTFTAGGTALGTIQFRNSSAANVSNDVYLWGAQLEAGAFATSYIPTTTAAATRSADVASITGANFSSWYNQAEGSFYGEATGLSGGGTITVRASADAGERMQFINGTGQTAVISLGAAQVLFGSPGTSKQAFAFKENDFAQKRVGVTLETDSSGTVPVVNMATIGKFDFGGQDSLNGTIRRLTYWPQRLANSVLQTITQ